MIPFLDLKAQYASIKGEIDAAVLDALASGAYVLGPKVAEFEQAFARYCQVGHCAGLNSGTSALHLALLALGIGPGDEVITTPMTFVATVAAIDYAGARPVFVDIDPHTWNIDPARIEAAITPRTKAIIPVHLHGLMADMAAIMKIAQRRGLAVIEDAAQAHGAECTISDERRRAGSVGDIACFSFYPGKNLGAFGEGGAVVTQREDLMRTIKLQRDWGQEAKYRHTLKGFNYRMEAIQGAILGVKLNHLEAWTEARRDNARRYDQRLKGKLPIPVEPSGFRHVYHVYAVRVQNRAEVLARLNTAGIASGIHYPIPTHLQPAYAAWGYQTGDFAVAEAVGAEFLSLPMFPELTEAQIDEVCRVLCDGI